MPARNIFGRMQRLPTIFLYVDKCCGLGLLKAAGDFFLLFTVANRCWFDGLVVNEKRLA